MHGVIRAEGGVSREVNDVSGFLFLLFYFFIIFYNVFIIFYNFLTPLFGGFDKRSEV